MKEALTHDMIEEDKIIVQEAYRVMAEILKPCNATVETERKASKYGKDLVAVFWQM